jgi:hypothetical protein
LVEICQGICGAVAAGPRFVLQDIGAWELLWARWFCKGGCHWWALQPSMSFLWWHEVQSIPMEVPPKRTGTCSLNMPTDHLQLDCFPNLFKVARWLDFLGAEIKQLNDTIAGEYAPGIVKLRKTSFLGQVRHDKIYGQKRG